MEDRRWKGGSRRGGLLEGGGLCHLPPLQLHNYTDDDHNDAVVIIAIKIIIIHITTAITIIIVTICLHEMWKVAGGRVEDGGVE